MVSCVDDWNVGGGASTNNESHSIKYDVPLYYQGQTNLCWAYCMIMRKSFDTGIELGPDDANIAAKELGKRYHPILGWNTGLSFFLLGEKASIDSIEDLYSIVCENGPVYATYKIPYSFNGHVVLVTGVDVDNDLVFTNNPWKVYGTQTFMEFMNGFAHDQLPYDSRNVFHAIYVPQP